MPKRKEGGYGITDDQIRAYDSVPIELAAKYLGSSGNTLRYALQDNRAPFGFASCHENDSAKTVWTYHISPGLLVAYKHGTIECVKMQDLVKLLTEELEYLFGGDKLLKIMLSGAVKTYEKIGA